MRRQLTYPLFDVAPALAGRLQRVPLGDYPTPVDAVAPEDLGLPARAAPLFIKREDISAEGYGGNKIRPLELMFGDALARGTRRIWATGSLGSNHAVATAIQGPRAGLQTGALLWPQPVSLTAIENLEAMLALDTELVCLPTIAAYPFSVAAVRLITGIGRGAADYVQAPGAAVPLGALGHLSAALELAAQVRDGVLPPPTDIVVGVGSTCTAAGLLVGVQLARHAGWAFADDPPTIHGVRVTPWPVTDARRIVGLALRTQALLAGLGGPDLGLPRRAYKAAFRLHARYIDGGYGKPSAAGRAAIARFARRDVLQLDTTYSAKAAAAALDLLEGDKARGPVLFWATKSSLPLPRPTPAQRAAAPAWVRRWLAG